MAFTDLTFASEKLATFVGKLIRRAAKMGIPLRCESASYDVAFIVHARRRQLVALEWAVIAHLGAEISQQYRLDVRWGGSLMPACWMGAAQGPSAPF